MMRDVGRAGRARAGDNAIERRRRARAERRRRFQRTDDARARRKTTTTTRLTCRTRDASDTSIDDGMES